jgi:hypothetical protein
LPHVREIAAFCLLGATHLGKPSSKLAIFNKLVGR